MDTNGQWKVQSEKPVKVVFNGNFIPPFSNTRPCSPTWQSVNTFESFTIIDDKGIQYVFGGSEAIEYSDVLMTFMPGGGSDVFKFTANAWQLTKIIAPDKQDSIVLNYERGPYQASLYKNYYSNLLMNSDCSNFSSVEANVGGRLISPVYLTSIVNNKNDLSISFTTSRSNELDYTTANFNELFDDHAGGVRRSISELVSCETGIPYFSDYRSDPDGAYTNSWDRLIWLKLNAMRVKHKGVDLKMISFVYDNTSSERLRLSEVNFKKTTSSTNILRYSFDYYEDYSLPVYLSVMGDHWGFNNTSSINSNVTPSNIFTLRSPTTLARARSGSLSQITYPTGGFSELIYEMHDYSSKVDNDTHETSSLSGTAGGLRLSQKIDHDNEGGDVSTSYYYVKNYQAGVDPSTLTSSGVLEGEPAYYYGGTVKDIGGSSFNYSNFSSSPVVPLTSNSSGQHIGYSEVAEVRGDGAYTIRKYTNHDNGYRDYVSVNTWNPQLLPQAPFNSRGHERGKLLGEYNYASDGAAVASTEYTYTRPASLTSYASRSIHQHFKNNCTNNANSSAVTRTAYYLYYYPFQLTKITSKTYGSANSNAVTSVKDMTYNSRNQLSTEKFTNSKGVQKTVAYTYACDQISGMSAKHMIDYVRTTTTSIPGETLSKQTVEFA